MPPQSNDLPQFTYCSVSAYEDDGKWIKDKAAITNDRAMVGKRLGCMLMKLKSEREIRKRRR
jgi:hypothetical protein